MSIDDTREVIKSDIERESWEIGKILLNEYQIELKLGIGGMGIVYLVKRVDSADRFAVKTLHSTLISDWNERISFIRELQTWMDLPEYPHLITCYFFRTIEDRFAIFAEFADGGSLSSYIAKGRVKTPAQLLDIAIQAAWGLAVAHRCGVVHQDIKPANILLSSTGVVKITDFGLSGTVLKSMQPSSITEFRPNDPGVTFKGMSIPYCSPEQSQLLKLDAGTDIWSLGVSILEMISGELTWDFGALASEILESLVARSSLTPLPLLPQKLVPILEACFRYDPHERYRDADVLANDLIQLYSEITGESYPRTKPNVDLSYLSGTPKIHRGSLSDAQWIDPRVWLAQLMDSEVFTASDKPDFSEKLLIGSHKTQSLIDLILFEEIEHMVKEFVANGKEQLYQFLIKLLRDKAAVLESQGDYPGAVKQLDEALALSQRFPNAVEEGVKAHYILQRATLLMHMRDTPGALESYNQAIEILLRLRTKSSDNKLCVHLAQAYLNKAIMFFLLRNHEEATAQCDLGLAVCVEAGLLQEKIGAILLLEKANELSALEQHDEALLLLEQSIPILQKVISQPDSDPHDVLTLANAYQNKAVLGNRKNNWDAAAQDFSNAIALYEQLTQHSAGAQFIPYLAITYSNLGLNRINADQYAEGIACIDKAVATLQHFVYTLGHDEYVIFLGSILLQYGEILFDHNEFQAAYDQLTAAVTVFQRLVDLEKRVELNEHLAQAQFLLALILEKAPGIARPTITADEALARYETEIHKFPRSSSKNQLEEYKKLLAQYRDEKNA